MAWHVGAQASCVSMCCDPLALVAKCSIASDRRFAGLFTHSTSISLTLSSSLPKRRSSPAAAPPPYGGWRRLLWQLPGAAVSTTTTITLLLLRDLSWTELLLRQTGAKSRPPLDTVPRGACTYLQVISRIPRDTVATNCCNDYSRQHKESHDDGRVVRRNVRLVLCLQLR